MKYIIVLLVSLIINGCSNNNPISTEDDDSFFGIYFLKDSTLTEREISNLGIDSLILDDIPWLTQNDIDFYDFSTHCIYLKNDKSYFFDNYKDNHFMFNPILFSKPFVTVTKTARCYVGALHSELLSLSPAGPYIGEFDIGYYPNDVLHISRAWTNDEDIRNDIRIKENLINQNLFHAGLEIEITSFQILNNSDTSTVEYSIKIINNDEDNLLVIDPEKMGSELFHFYTNGPDLWGNNKSIYLYSQNKEVVSPDPYDSWDISWFTTIKSNETLERTIRLKGYPYIPIGSYGVSMKFSNPWKISKEKRYTGDGRIWIGSIKSNVIDITVKN